MCQRNAIPATLAMIDLDGFKRINNELGHDEGDAALIEFTRCLIRSCRESDIIARLYGDEFCGFFSGSRLDDLQAALQRLETQVAAANESRNRDYPIRFTIGAASWAPGEEAGLESLMRTADESMLRHKRWRRVAGAR